MYLTPYEWIPPAIATVVLVIIIVRDRLRRQAPPP
jgi:hypothetical protein